MYVPRKVNIEFNLYENAARFDLPMGKIAEIENGLHRSYVISASLPLVAVDSWMANVTPEYFELNQMTEQEFKKKVSQLGREKRRTDFLVYDVRVRLEDQEYAVLAISRDSDVLKWEKGMNLSTAIFEKDPDGRWLRTSLAPSHWIYWIPFMNVDALGELESGSSILVDELNIVRYLMTSDVEALDRVPFLEH